METLRTPFFLAALGTMVVVLLVEAGGDGFFGNGDGGAVNLAGATVLLERIGVDQTESLADMGSVSSQGSRDGRGLTYLMLIDGILLFTVSLIAVSLLVRERIQGRVQGIATFIFSLILGLVAILATLAAVTELILMVSLLLSPPFGTIAYMATYASFDRSAAAVVLTLLITLKFAFSVLLIVAQQRFLQNKGLMALLITSFLATVIVSFLHSLVPLFLVSITDVIAAIIVAVVAIIWAVVLLFGSVKSVLKAIGI